MTRFAPRLLAMVVLAICPLALDAQGRPVPHEALAAARDRYQRLAADSTLRAPRITGVLRAGEPFADAVSLRRLLTAVGDLSAADATVGGYADADTLYDSSLVAGVVAFQRRHGLEPDGIVGRATGAQLAVPLDRRVRQLDLAIERWRTLGDTGAGRMVVVNVPAFRLHAVDRDAATGRPSLTMNVIVGQASGGHATPLFSGTMREVVFQPYWDVPISIARNELLPLIRRDPRYLDRNAMEIVRGGDHDAVVHAPTSANFARVAAGTLRLRQRPGASNALGAVKFVFPNRFNVYLHGTPNPELFDRQRRDFSHGCIRVADPPGLAEWVLSGEAGWDAAAVAAAMTTGPRSHRLTLRAPIPVHVLYATAEVGDDGIVHFHPDLYGHDAAHFRAAADAAPAATPAAASGETERIREFPTAAPAVPDRSPPRAGPSMP